MLAFYRDDEGLPRVRTGEGRHVVGAFLEQDVQRSERVCQQLADAVEKASRTGVEWVQSGNAHEVRFSDGIVIIENLWDETIESADLTYDEFASALEQWRQFACSDGSASGEQ